MLLGFPSMSLSPSLSLGFCPSPALFLSASFSASFCFIIPSLCFCIYVAFSRCFILSCSLPFLFALRTYCVPFSLRFVFADAGLADGVPTSGKPAPQDPALWTPPSCSAKDTACSCPRHTSRSSCPASGVLCSGAWIPAAAAACARC